MDNYSMKEARDQIFENLDLLQGKLGGPMLLMPAEIVRRLCECLRITAGDMHFNCDTCAKDLLVVRDILSRGKTNVEL